MFVKTRYLLSVIISALLLIATSTWCVATPHELSLRNSDNDDPSQNLTPVPATTATNPANGSATDHRILDLPKILNFYNTERLATHWPEISALVSGYCRRDLDTYLKGLGRHEQWALKMDDASGRYSTGWFWGNHYWTGSQSLCNNIAPKKAPSVLLKHVRPQESSVATAPFGVSFYMVRLKMNTTVTTDERTIHVGYCLPYSCTDEDVKMLIQTTSTLSALRDNIETNVNVLQVRSPHNYYDIWQDTTFRILCVVTGFVTILLFLGTGLDFYLEYYDGKEEQAPIKLDIRTTTNGTINKDKNGNCTLYVNGATTNREIFINNVRRPPSITGALLREALLAFSIRANLRTICDRTVSSDTIPVIHGLKTISMAWVILGHTCIVAFKYSDNMEYRKVVQREFFFQTISNGTFSVDTFFFTSGLLVSFLYFRTNAKGKLDRLTNGRSRLLGGVLHFFGLIFYRFARLTAPYLFTLGMVEVLMKWFNYNSIFEPPTMDHINCPNYWWRNVLYINTLFPVKDMCMLWSWYLSDDTQFYVVGAVMLILATRHFKIAAGLMAVFMVSSWLTTGYIAYINRHIPGSDDPLALFDKIYDKPWTRLGPYLVGMSVGWFLFRNDCQLRLPKTLMALGWLVSFSTLLAMIYGLYEADLTPLGGATYSSLSHSAWALGLAWIVVACATGHGGPVNAILSSTLLYPFSRVTYCAYLVHPIVIRAMAMTMDSPIHLGSMVMVIIFFGQVVAAYAVSFFVSLVFEAPIVSLLRIMSKAETLVSTRSLPVT